MATRALTPPSHAYEALLDQHRLCERGDVSSRSSAIPRAGVSRRHAIPVPYRQAPPQSSAHRGYLPAGRRDPAALSRGSRDGCVWTRRSLSCPGEQLQPAPDPDYVPRLPASSLGWFGWLAPRRAPIGPYRGRFDGEGGSFLPYQPFAAGETVTVSTDLNLIGSGSGTFSFQIAQPWGLFRTASSR